MICDIHWRTNIDFCEFMYGSTSHLLVHISNFRFGDIFAIYFQIPMVRLLMFQVAHLRINIGLMRILHYIAIFCILFRVFKHVELNHA